MKFSTLVKVVLSALLLTGCANPHTSYNEKGPNIMTVYSSDNEYFYYAIDENTEVVYLMFIATYRGGITVAYNADGTIMKKSDLHLEDD